MYQVGLIGDDTHAVVLNWEPLGSNRDEVIAAIYIIRLDMRIKWHNKKNERKTPPNLDVRP